MFRHSGLISGSNRAWRMLSIAVVAAMLGALLLPVPGMATQGKTQVELQTVTLRSTQVELQEEGGNVRGYARTPFDNQGTGVIETSLDVNGTDPLFYQLGGSYISVRNLDTNQLVHSGWGDKEFVEYCGARAGCSRVYNYFDISANARYQAELVVDYGVLVLPIKDYKVSATVSGLTLNSTNVVLRKEGDEIRGIARVRFTPDSDGQIDWSLNATGPDNIPDWINSIPPLLKYWLIEVFKAWNIAEENLPYQLGGSKLLIRNVNTGELVLQPQEFCSARIPTPRDECKGKSDRVFVSKGVTYEAELWVDYGVLIGLIKDHVLTAEFHQKIDVEDGDPPDESCQNPFQPTSLPYSGNLEFSGDHDWQRIQSPVKGTMVLILDVPVGKDYQLEVSNDSCAPVLAGSQNGRGVDERIVIPVDPGYYRVHVSGANAEDWGEPYTVSAKWDLNDNQWEDAVFFDLPFQGDLEYGDDHDWQRVHVPAGNTFLVLDVPDDRNYQFEVWRDDIKQLLGSSMNSTGVSESVMILQPGDYRVHIFGADPASDFDAPYRVFLDGTPPTTTLSIAGTMGDNGWYRSNIELVLNAADNMDGTGVLKTEYGFAAMSDAEFSGPWYIYTTPLQGTLEGSGYLVYRSIDQAGNIEPYQMQFIGVDKTPPAVHVIAPQSMDYLHSATFYLLWKPFEKGSGIATSSTMLDGQPVANGNLVDLFFLNLGPHTVSIQATDTAGNTTSLTVPFNVVADIDSLRAVTRRAYDLGWINKQSTYNNLDATLRAAERSMDQGHFQIARRQLLLFIAQLRIYNGKSINQQAYDLLRADALYVLLHLS